VDEAQPDVGQLTRIRIVLVETSHPGNIGSCARAMKNMGLTDLFLVNPKSFPHPAAVELSAGADDILENAVVVESLPQALEGCACVFVTSARARSLALPGLTPALAADYVMREHVDTSVAFVFGREQSGLTNLELLQGQFHIYIPANPAYTSLNIAQAVQIIAYELRMRALNPVAQVAMRQDPLADHEAIEQFYEHLSRVLKEIGFLKTVAPRRLMERMRRLYGRIQLEAPEVNLLRGMLNRIQYCLNNVRSSFPKENDFEE
jgi:tRNA (cytidine32/uridine32-2'-O)-methyltransferase